MALKRYEFGEDLGFDNLGCHSILLLTPSSAVLGCA
jgi:hypothetical protein